MDSLQFCLSRTNVAARTTWQPAFTGNEGLYIILHQSVPEFSSYYQLRWQVKILKDSLSTISLGSREISFATPLKLRCFLYPFITQFPAVLYVVIGRVTNVYAVIQNSIFGIIVHLVIVQYRKVISNFVFVIEFYLYERFLAQQHIFLRNVRCFWFQLYTTDD